MVATGDDAAEVSQNSGAGGGGRTPTEGNLR